MMQTTPDDYTFRLEYTNHAGNLEELYDDVTYDPHTKQMSGNWRFMEYNKGGKIIGERIRPLLIRQTTRWEMMLLAKLCGFEVLDIYRGYSGDKEDLSDISSAYKFKGDLIWILKKTE